MKEDGKEECRDVAAPDSFELTRSSADTPTEAVAYGTFNDAKHKKYNPTSSDWEDKDGDAAKGRW